MICVLLAALLSLPDQHLTEVAAAEHIYWATQAETATLDAPLLLAVAWRETRFDETSVSGRWRYCGVLQTQAHGYKSRCLDQQNLNVGYGLGVLELEEWLHHSHGNLKHALAHHACGNRMRYQRPDGSWCEGLRYAASVMKMADALRAAMVETA